MTPKRQAREQAIKDIKEELEREHKAFIAFRKELNPVMNELVKEQLQEQHRRSWCLSIWHK